MRRLSLVLERRRICGTISWTSCIEIRAPTHGMPPAESDPRFVHLSPQVQRVRSHSSDSKNVAIAAGITTHKYTLIRSNSETISE